VDLDNNKLWKKEMIEVIDALDNNETWNLVELLVGIKPIGSKWVFIASFDIELDKMGVKTRFLHVDIEKENYMKQQEGFVVNERRNHLIK